MLLVQVNPRRQRNMLLSRGGLLQRNRRGQVWRGGRRDRCQGVLQQGLQRLRRVHQLRQQCRRRQRDGRLLQWLWQVSDHNGKKAIAATNALHSFKLFQICKKSTVAFLDAKIGGASKVNKKCFSSNQYKNIIPGGCVEGRRHHVHRLHRRLPRPWQCLLQIPGLPLNITKKTVVDKLWVKSSFSNMWNPGAGWG